MKYIAIVPWGEEYQKDQLFNLNNKKLNRDNALKVYVDIKLKMLECGYEIHTIDCYKDISIVDLFVFFCFDQMQYLKIHKRGLVDRTLYIAFEPPVVDQNHTEEGIHNLLNYYHYILTWNDDLVDNNRIFKFMYPHDLIVSKSEIDFDKKKLLVNISGNKKSSHKYELYTEREKVISFFDGNSEFELYGTNWSEVNHSSYKGLAQSKKNVYHRFKFALCLENMWNINGYVTEKILDCFCAGIVPIYLGAKNINKYVPSNCFISYDGFENLNELEKFLSSISEEEYNFYIENINKYLQSPDVQIFSASQFCKRVLNVANMSGEHFKPKGMLAGIRVKCFFNKIRTKISALKNKKNKQIMRNVSIGKNSSVDNNSSIGEYTYLGKNCLVTKASIGRFCSIGNNVSIGPGEHKLERISTSSFVYDYKVDWYSELTEDDVVIGNDVWIGTDSIVRRGITVGNGAVIGANSFVNSDVPDFAIVAGNPARIIRYRFSTSIIDKINASQWWNYDIKNARRVVESLELELSKK